MLAIKKVAITPIPKTEGKIIDSFDTTDDKRTNAPSARATKEYIDKNLPKIYTGTEAPSADLGKNGDIYFQVNS